MRPIYTDCEMLTCFSGAQIIVVRLPRTASMISSLMGLIIVWRNSPEVLQSKESRALCKDLKKALLRKR